MIHNKITTRVLGWDPIGQFLVIFSLNPPILKIKTLSLKLSGCVRGLKWVLILCLPTEYT